MRKRVQPYRILPALPPEERAKLKESIARYGVIHPITLEEKGHILDGHERQAICLELGVACPAHTLPRLTDEQKIELVYHPNLRRRQVSEQQRQAVAITLHRRGLSASTIAKFVGLPNFLVMGWVSPEKRDTDSNQPTGVCRTTAAPPCPLWCAAA